MSGGGGGGGGKKCSEPGYVVADLIALNPDNPKPEPLHGRAVRAVVKREQDLVESRICLRL